MRRGTAVLLVAAWLVSTVAGAGPKARITLEVLTKPGLPPAATQQWYQALSNLGLAGLQIHSGRAADEANIREQGTKASPAYKVVGILSADNVLYLPGGKFRSGETARLKKWLDELADQGAEGVTERRTAFAFTPRQFDDVKADLKKPVAFFTKGVPTSKVINKMARGLKYSFEIDDGAKRAVAGVEVADEFNGLSTGTALAAVLRPCGLAFEPQ
ncbi:MAG TPA: hypothetical protein VGX76_12215, partial [Pirellulales bacterium]|nr:hypothetical protein [Pirellulales bacterium]